MEPDKIETTDVEGAETEKPTLTDAPEKATTTVTTITSTTAGGSVAGQGVGSYIISDDTTAEIDANKSKIYLLGFYLLVIVFICIYLLGALMTAETDKDRINAKLGITPSPTAATPASTATPTATPKPTATQTPVIVNPSGSNSAGNSNSLGNTNTPNTAPSGTPSPSPSPSLSPSGQNFVEADIPRDIYVYVPLGITTFSQIISADAYVFLIVLFAGMLGGAVRGIYSFVRHLGLKNFSLNWAWFYITLPFTGAALGLLIYFVMRGGFYGASVGKGLVFNPFSFAALAALTGLFTDNAMEKLKQVADTLLTPPPPKVQNAKEIVEKEEAEKKKS
jgi:hypothetical protein